MTNPALADLLIQGKVWVTGDDEVVKVKHLKYSHAVNLERWLLRKAPAFKESMTAEMYHFAGMLNGEMAQDSIDSAIDQVEAQSPVEWMRDQELYRAVVKRIKKGNTVHEREYGESAPTTSVADDFKQIKTRARKMATHLDETTIALGQRSAPVVSAAVALEQIKAMAPLEQALVRYRLKMLDSLATHPLD